MIFYLVPKTFSVKKGNYEFSQYPPFTILLLLCSKNQMSLITLTLKKQVFKSVKDEVKHTQIQLQSCGIMPLKTLFTKALIV